MRSPITSLHLSRAVDAVLFVSTELGPRAIRLFLVFSLLVGVAANARADIIFTAQEVGSDVVISSNGGSLDLTGVTLLGTGLVNGTVRPNAGRLWVGAASVNTTQYFVDASIFSGPSVFGSGGATSISSSPSSVIAGIDVQASGAVVGVPFGYTSNDALPVLSSTYAGHTFASLGITEGTYVWTWDVDGPGGTLQQSITFSTTAVPEPSSFALVGLAAVGLGLLYRRNRRAAKAHAK